MAGISKVSLSKTDFDSLKKNGIYSNKYDAIEKNNSLNVIDDYDIFENVYIDKENDVITLSDEEGVLGYIDKDTYDALTENNDKSKVKKEPKKIDDDPKKKVSDSKTDFGDKVNNYIEDLKESVIVAVDVVSKNCGAMVAGGVIGVAIVSGLGFEIGAVVVAGVICSSIAGGISSIIHDYE